MPTPSNIRVLLDTNIIIQAEDNKLVKPAFAALVQKCQKHGVILYVHEASIEDIRRDKDAARQGITLSKIQKYQQLTGIPRPPDADLTQQYGTIKKDNDRVDMLLMHAVKISAVTFLVSEDIGLHDRAEAAGIGNRVLTVLEVLDWIKQTYEPKEVELPHVASLGCHQVDVNQDIFTSLKADYPEFEDWFQKTCIPKHRPCWAVKEKEEILAIAIWKEESGNDFSAEFEEKLASVEEKEKVLKICTFKVHDKVRGSKIGEHLLKQAIWYAYENKFNYIYLTAFAEKQAYLISFLETFGFFVMWRKNTGEVIIAKQVLRSGQDLNGKTPLEFHKQFYPHFYEGEKVGKFVIPIQPDYHLKLFPEYTPLLQSRLFADGVSDGISGNAIRKIYLCRAQDTRLDVGDIIVFYMSKGDNFDYSQSLTTIGIVDGVNECTSLDELIQVTAKRSVYSHAQLENIFSIKNTPVKTIDFFIAGHLQGVGNRPLNLKELKAAGILKSAPQSVLKLDEQRYQILKQKVKVVYSYEVT